MVFNKDSNKILTQWGTVTVNVTLKTATYKTYTIFFQGFRNKYYGVHLTPVQSDAGTSFGVAVDDVTLSYAAIKIGNISGHTKTLTGYNWFAIGLY